MVEEEVAKNKRKRHGDGELNYVDGDCLPWY